MLTRVFLSNFVHFGVKDGDKEEVKDKEEEQRNGVPEFEFCEGGAFFFIGGNRSGKSCVFEAIRRCMSTSKNFFFSTCDDKEKPLVVICEFSDKLLNETYYSCYVSIQPENKGKGATSSAASKTVGEKSVLDRIVVKIFFIKDQYINDSPSIKKLSVDVLKANKDGFPVNYCFELGKNTQSGQHGENPEKYLFKDITIQLIQSFVQECILGTNQLKGIVEEEIQEYNGETPCEKALKRHIDKQIVITDPMRSISPVQWTKSKKLDIVQRTKQNINFAMEMKDRSEILAWYLDKKIPKSKEGEDSSEFIMNVDKIFNILTNNSRVKFEKNGDEIVVIDNGNIISLEKAPEGIFEAMICSILLSIKEVKTVCLEEPGRGMHMQMVERLRDLILKKIKDKTVIIISHNPTFITSWNFESIFFFKGLITKENKSRFIVTKGKSILPIEELKTKRIMTSNTMATIFFAKRVLLVEGEFDLLFFTELKSILIENNGCILDRLFSKLNVSECSVEGFRTFLSSLHILSMNGQQNKARLNKICQALQIERYFVLDYDVVIAPVKEDDNYKKFEECFELSGCSMEEIKADVSVLEKERLFIWRPEPPLCKDELQSLRKNKRLEGVKTGTIEYALFSLCIMSENLDKIFSDNRMSKNPNDETGSYANVKLFKKKQITDENITAVVKAVLEVSDSLIQSDVFRFVEFLAHAHNKLENT